MNPSPRDHSLSLPEARRKKDPEQRLSALKKILEWQLKTFYASELPRIQREEGRVEVGLLAKMATDQGLFPSSRPGDVLHAIAIRNADEHYGGVLKKTGVRVSGEDRERACEAVTAAITDIGRRMDPADYRSLLVDSHAGSNSRPLSAIKSVGDQKFQLIELVNRLDDLLAGIDREQEREAYDDIDPAQGVASVEQRFRRHHHLFPGVSVGDLESAVQLRRELDKDPDALDHRTGAETRLAIQTLMRAVESVEKPDTGAQGAASSGGVEGEAPVGSSMQTKVIIGVLGALVLILLVSRFSGTSRAEGGQSSGGGLGSVDPAIERQRKEQEALQVQRDALARSKCEGLLGEIAAARKLAVEFDEELKLWRDAVLVLLTNDDGKRLACSDTAVTTYRQLVLEDRKPRRGEDFSRSGRQALDTLEAATKTARDVPMAPDAPNAKQVAELTSQLRAAVGEYRDAREQVLALVRSSTATGDVPLQEAIQKQKEAHAKQRADLVASETDKARQQGDAEIARQQSETLLAKKQAEAAAEAKARFEQEAKDPTLVQSAQFILARGKKSFAMRAQGNLFHFGYGEMPEAAPVRLECLQPILADFKLFAYCATKTDHRTNEGLTYSQNDRPATNVAPFPPNDAHGDPDWDSPEAKRLRELWEKCRRYAPYWHQIGWLK